MSDLDRPAFATNTPERTVADAVNGHLSWLRTTWAEPPDVAIATAYFNVGGYSLLADELEEVATVRLLLGAEPEAELRLRALREEPADPLLSGRHRLRRALEGLDHSLEQARNLLGFDFEADQTAQRLITWLRSGRIEVRRLEDRFLHGKAFIVTTHDEGVIAGSSNFTYAGLAKNVELNLGRYEPAVVGEVRGWFDELWDEAEPFDLAGLYEARFDEHRPQLVYLRMLWERYGEELEEEARSHGRAQIHLTGFQTDGLWRARRIMATLGGVLIADEVGLGKTFLAGELIREAVLDRRQRVLVIAPATLRDGPWRKFLFDHMLPVEVVSFEDLLSDERLSPHSGSGAKLRANINEYAMVVIDEAHNLRNPSTLRAEAIRRLLAGRPTKDLVLLTATPVNNSLWDLYYLLAYFLRNDGIFADVGIKSLRDHFAAAMAMNPDDLSPEHLFDVLDAVAVRRTRSFVKKFYPHDTIKLDGKNVPITFPTPRVLKVTYELDDVLPGFFGRLAHALDHDETIGPEDDPGVLTFARYMPSRYRRDRDDAQDAHELQLAGLLRSGLLKRFESSPHAFARTCRTMAASHDAFLSLLEQGKVATGDALADWVATDSDDIDEIDTYLDGHLDIIDDAAEFDADALASHVEHDRHLLIDFAETAEAVRREDDPTLAALVEELAAIVAQADEEGIGDEDTRDKRKVIVFSYFADTVSWIEDHLAFVVESDPRLAPYKGRMTVLSGQQGDKTEVLYGFAPRTTDAPEGLDDDKYDVLITTDVLAEGVNLQQARHILNYDLPWNPQRLVQRHGRIDRIGSPHSEVFLRCVFPDRMLDDLLGLEERLHRKITQAAKSVGAGEILPGSTTTDLAFAETREQIEKLRAENPELFDVGGVGKGALSGEEYRQELRQALEDPELARRVKALPWGSGSGMAIASDLPGPAYVFCVRVGDHPRPLFRYVEMGHDDGPPIVEDTLACLDHARPSDGWNTPRHLDDATYETAFGAWSVAHSHIVERWNHFVDPANLAPKVPAAMHRAAEIVRQHHPADMDVEEVDRAVEALQAPYPERILRTVRAALGATDDPAEQAKLVVGLISELGLEPSPAPEPLPEITHDDVHLICWLALVPSTLSEG